MTTAQTQLCTVPGLVDCPACSGRGEIAHPLYGSRCCPEPSMTCPVCRGDCEITPATADDWNAEHRLPPVAVSESGFFTTEPF